MKLLISLVIGLSVGFGAGYAVFHQEVDKRMTITLNDADKMPPEQVRRILSNTWCEQIGRQTIQCKI